MYKSTLVAAALASLSTALPVASATGFSFESWANGISSNPNGNHLSVEEAVAAFKANRATASDSRSLVCDALKKYPAYVPDAAAAVEILAKRGDTTCVLNDSSVIFAEKNQAAIFAGVDIANPLITAQGPCKEFTAAAARVLDQCAHGDKVQGTYFVESNKDIAITIVDKAIESGEGDDDDEIDTL